MHPHLLMVLVGAVKIIHMECQVEFALSQIICFLPVPQPGQLQLKIGLSISQVHQLEGAI